MSTQQDSLASDSVQAPQLLMDADRNTGPGPATAVQHRKVMHRAIFLSDMHLGTRMAHPDKILGFLESHAAETYYLIGDIVDNWYPLTLNWTPSHHEVLRRILALPQSGSRVVFIPGNHDAFFRNYAGTNFGGIEVVNKATHLAADGRRYLLTHGDCCDVFSVRAPIMARVGSLIEKVARGVDAAQKPILQRLGLNRWSGIDRAINRTNAAIRKHDRFEERLSDLARAGGYDGIVCGHFHQPALHDAHGVIYANCGDWTGCNSAIVEDVNGRLGLLGMAPATSPTHGWNGRTGLEGEPVLAG